MKPFRLYQVTFPNVTLAPCLWRCWLPPGQPPLVPQPLQFSQPPSPAGTLPGDEQRAVLQGGMPSSANVFLGVVPHWATVTSSFILTPMTVFRGVLDVVGLLAHPLSVWPLGSSPHGRGDFSLRPAQRSGPSDPYCPIELPMTMLIVRFCTGRMVPASRRIGYVDSIMISFLLIQITWPHVATVLDDTILEPEGNAGCSSQPGF